MTRGFLLLATKSTSARINQENMAIKVAKK